MTALRVSLVLLLASCGGFLPFVGDDDEDPPPAPIPSSADAADDGAADVSSADGSNEAAVGQDGGFACFPGGICVDDETECCSGKTVRQAGCTLKCEIACCLP